MQSRLTFLFTLLLSLLLAACGADAPDGPTLQPPGPPQGRPEVRADVPPVAGTRPVHGAEATSADLAVRMQGAVGKRDRAAAKGLSRVAPAGPGVPRQYLPDAPVDRDKYAAIDANGVRLVGEQPVSTFSIDVDTGAYAIVRRHLNDGRMPPGDAVRTEELINYFSYAYPQPGADGAPFSISTEVAPTPWNDRTHLVQIGLQGALPATGGRPDANLVFLVDVSGSMQSADKLPLLKRAFRLLVDQLGAGDRVSMVVYAGASGIVLEPTPGNRKATILAALDKLTAGGSTHGSAGIELAYAMADEAHIEDGINRVILATDGDFNVGTVNHAALVDLIRQKKVAGTGLTTLGFGSGNYNDHLMEQLADHGDGNYAYIDSLGEARKVLVEELSATLETIARDVKIQVEWNPAVVSEYRLIGYENRLLRREDFRNDKVDAGDIGAGHSVTALYEITLVGDAPGRVDPLRYAAQDAQTGAGAHTDELAHIRLRYKQPDATRSLELSRTIRRDGILADFARGSSDLRFATAVAGFGELLRGGENLHDFGYREILQIAREARGEDAQGYRGEFLGLVGLSQALDQRG